MPNRKPRILIIDDDEGFCRLASKHFERADYDIAIANTAAEGLACLERNTIDVVVLDHVLPEHDGLALLATLQSRPGSPPVVYLTGSQESRVAVAALKAGAADYVVKDVHSDFLLLLENAVTNAMLATAIRRDKEKAEAEVRQARDQFKALAEERALLLREVNHRVSNSLQLIASLLHLQGDVSKSSDVKAALKEAIGRVLAVSRVHRSLYTSFDVRRVSLAEYLANLIHDLEDVSAGAEGPANAITFSSDKVQASPDTAVAVGIVLTELVLNALKHAYPSGKGPVRVRLEAKPPNIELIVEDDGVGGLKADKDRPCSGIGHRIIEGMADKLDGTLRFEKLPSGSHAVLVFPINDHIRIFTGEPQTASAS